MRDKVVVSSKCAHSRCLACKAREVVVGLLLHHLRWLLHLVLGRDCSRVAIERVLVAWEQILLILTSILTKVHRRRLDQMSQVREAVYCLLTVVWRLVSLVLAKLVWVEEWRGIWVEVRITCKQVAILCIDLLHSKQLVVDSEVLMIRILRVGWRQRGLLHLLLKFNSAESLVAEYHQVGLHEPFILHARAPLSVVALVEQRMWAEPKLMRTLLLFQQLLVVKDLLFHELLSVVFFSVTALVRECLLLNWQLV